MVPTLIDASGVCVIGDDASDDMTVNRSVWAEFTKGMGDRMRLRRDIIRLLPDAGPLLVGSGVLAQVIAGLLPVGFVLATAAVIADVPAAVRGGVDSAQWVVLRDHLIGAAALFFAVQLLLPVQAFVGELLRRRIDDRLPGPADGRRVRRWRGGRAGGPGAARPRRRQRQHAAGVHLDAGRGRRRADRPDLELPADARRGGRGRGGVRVVGDPRRAARRADHPLRVPGRTVGVRPHLPQPLPGTGGSGGISGGC